MTPTRSPSQSHTTVTQTTRFFYLPPFPTQFSWALVASPLFVPVKSTSTTFHSIASLCASLCPRLPRRGPLRKGQIVFLLASARPTIMAALLRRTDCWVHMALPLEPTDSVSPGCLGTSGTKWWKEMMSHRTGFLSAT